MRIIARAIFSKVQELAFEYRLQFHSMFQPVNVSHAAVAIYIYSIVYTNRLDSTETGAR